MLPREVEHFPDAAEETEARRDDRRAGTALSGEHRVGDRVERVSPRGPNVTRAQLGADRDTFGPYIDPKVSQAQRERGRDTLGTG